MWLTVGCAFLWLRWFNRLVIQTVVTHNPVSVQSDQSAVGQLGPLTYRRPAVLPPPLQGPPPDTRNKRWIIRAWASGPSNKTLQKSHLNIFKPREKQSFYFSCQPTIGTTNESCVLTVNIDVMKSALYTDLLDHNSKQQTSLVPLLGIGSLLTWCSLPLCVSVCAVNGVCAMAV